MLLPLVMALANSTYPKDHSGVHCTDAVNGTKVFAVRGATLAKLAKKQKILPRPANETCWMPDRYKSVKNGTLYHDVNYLNAIIADVWVHGADQYVCTVWWNYKPAGANKTTSANCTIQYVAHDVGTSSTQLPLA